MKKYYLVGTDEEVLMGDTIVDVPFEKTFDNGITLKRKEEFEVTEDSLPYLLDMGVLEECDEEEDDLVDFDGEETCEAVEELEERTIKLESAIDSLKARMMRVESSLRHIDNVFAAEGLEAETKDKDTEAPWETKEKKVSKKK